METIDITENSVPAIYLLNIISETGQVKEIAEKSPDQKRTGKVEVCLTINGIEVSWIEFTNKRWEIREEEIERRATQKLESMISFNKLKDIMHDIENIEWKLKDSVETLIGEKIEWSNY